ncbi:glycosyltransferase family 4 protein [Vibrio cyclitrophicus]
MSKNKLVFLTSNTSWYLYNFRRSTILSLIERGYQPICIAPTDDYSQKLVALGAKFVALGVEGKSTNPLKELFVFFKMIKILKGYKPKFVFNFTIKMNIYVGLCCALLKIPFANNVSGLGTAFLHKGVAYSLAKRLYGLSNYFAKTVFFQNDEDRNLFNTLGLVNKEKTILLPGSGVNVTEYQYKRLSRESRTRTFLMIARVIADKGVREYVEAANAVQQEFPDTRFILVGDWNISNKSAFDESIINDWQENSAVEFMGHQDDVRSWIYKNDVVVLPSYREGMPRTILEAASCGRPAIVSDVPGCRHAIVAESTGWLCEVRSSESLATKMKETLLLSTDELEVFGQSARKHIEDNFSDVLVVNACMNVLNDI